VQVEIDQGEAGAQPVMVLRDPPVSHLVEAEDAFQDAEPMFYFRSYFRLSCVLAFPFFVQSSGPEESHLQPLTGRVEDLFPGFHQEISRRSPPKAIFLCQYLSDPIAESR
jgi:hypothetical protein